MDKSSYNSEYFKSLENTVELLQKDIEALRKNVKSELDTNEQTTDDSKSAISHSVSAILNSNNAVDILNVLDKIFGSDAGIIETAIFKYDVTDLLEDLSIESTNSEKFMSAVNYFQENGIISWAAGLSTPSLIPDPFVKEHQQSYYILLPLTLKSKVIGMLVSYSTNTKIDIENNFIPIISTLTDILAAAVEKIISYKIFTDLNTRIQELSSRADINSQLASFGELAIRISEESLLPIKIIESNIELIRTGIDAKEKRFEIIQEQLNILKTINTKLIDYFDMISQNNKLRERVNLRLLLNETLIFLDKGLQRYGISYEILTPENDIFVNWNKIELEQTILGIIMFCSYNMIEGGHLVISYSQLNRKTVSISISDNAEALSDLNSITVWDKSNKPKHIKHDLVSFYSINHYLTRNKSKIEFQPIAGIGNTFRLICPIA